MKATKITTLDEELEVLEESIDVFLLTLSYTEGIKKREIIDDKIISLEQEYRALTGHYYIGIPYKRKI